MRSVAALMMLLALAFPAGAYESRSEEKPASPETEAVIAFGVSHPECREWTDGCVICTRGSDALHCSTPGIACQPGETVCQPAPK
jgi:hypothetical protein